MTKSNGCMFTLLSYFEANDTTQYQLVNKDFYNRVLPRAVIKIEMPRVNLVLERSRKHIFMGFWRENVRDL